MERELMRIGALARASGVPVKTIRHYSDLGILPPAARSSAGYRLYRIGDRTRLEMIRTLRSAGFDLTTIGDLLRGAGSMRTAVDLQLEAIELQLRALQRQRAVLRHVRRSDGEIHVDHLERLQSLARLGALEREAFVAAGLERTVDGVAVDPDWKAWMWQAVLGALPAELDDDALEAWIELADLMSDESFLERLHRLAVSFWESLPEGFDMTGWHAENGAVIAEAAAASEAGTPPGERPDLIDRFLELQTPVHDNAVGVELATRVVAHVEATHEPRAERFWELVAKLQGRPPRHDISRAFWWLVDGVRARVTNSSATTD